MTRAILVGLAAALLLFILLSTSAYLEMRYTTFGGFMRASAGEMQREHVSSQYRATYGDPVDFLGRWVRINQLLVDPALCVIVGVLIGLLSPRVVLATIIGVLPVVIMNSPPDKFGSLSIVICAVACWGTACAAQRVVASGNSSGPQGVAQPPSTGE